VRRSWQAYCCIEAFESIRHRFDNYSFLDELKRITITTTELAPLTEPLPNGWNTDVVEDPHSDHPNELGGVYGFKYEEDGWTIIFQIAEDNGIKYEASVSITIIHPEHRIVRTRLRITTGLKVNVFSFLADPDPND
jgi:hypothetical protein